MKISPNSRTRRLSWLGFLALALCIFATSVARAGLTFELQIFQYGSQNNYTYYFNPQLVTNSVGANVSFGNYALTSFGIPTNGSSSFWQYDANGFNQTDGDRNGYNDFNSMVHEITNGVWSLFITNATMTNVYHFKVALNISSNDLPKVLITAPLDGAVDVTNQPTFTWQGPANYSSLAVSEFNTSQSLPASQTSWLSPQVLYQGANNFNVDYVSNSITAAVASIPTNSLAQTFSGWLSTNVLDVSYGCQFSVGLLDTSGGAHVLVAHYPFDATSGSVLDAAVDTSGNGLNMSAGSPFGSQGGDSLSSDSAAGIGAVLFQDGDNNSGAYVGWTDPTPPALLSALSGSFSVSCWIKTTQNIAWNTAPAYYGAGIVSADNFGLANDVIPIALTGGSIAFNTGGSEDVTLNSVASVNDGNYHHIVVTRNQITGQKIIYIDGQFDSFSSGTTNLLSDPQKLTIGALANAGNPDPNDGSYYQGFAGDLDDLQIYSGVLSASDVANLYASPGSTAAATLDFNTALGTTGLNWSTSGDSSWFIEATNTANGAPYAAQSDSITDDQSSTLSVTVTGPGTLTFYWASEASGDFDYEFDIDGSYGDDISGYTDWYQEVDWRTGQPYVIPAGQHTLTWTTYANGDTDPTEAGFLGQVNYVAETAPTLAVTAAPTSGAVMLTVQFTSPTLDSFGNTVTNWNWAFGDGDTNTAQSPSHTYLTTGSFSPGLTAYSTFGSAALAVSGLGTIIVSNATLNVSTIPASGLAPLTVQFASPGVDSGGNTVTNWNWSFGDGGTSTAQNPVHVYPSIGSYSPGLVAQSTHGASALPVAGLGTINVYSNPAPAFHTLYTFSPNFGKAPDGDLAISGNQLYGTTENGGGSNGAGTVFAINTDGNAFTNLYVFASGGNGYPIGGLVLSGSTLFGIGSSVFAINTNGTGYTNLLNLIYAFDSTTGYNPVGGLALSGNTLYGTTWYGGSYDEGVIFSVATNGVSHGILHAFYPPTYNPYAINYDGIFPSARLICPAGTLYGTAEQGGSYGGGTVFSVVTNEPGSYTVLHNFTAPALNGTNIDGYASFSALVLSGTNLYGTTLGGGAYGYGTVFAVSTSGQFTNLYYFTGGSDGSEPQAGLVLIGNTLYGTTTAGGALTNGTLFAINTDGSNFKSLYSFTGGNDGGDPAADLVFSVTTLFGTATKGGSTGNGTIFSFALAGPPLAIAHSGTNVILTWSTAYSGYTLQSSLQLGAAASWSAVSPLPVILNSLNTVTNPISATARFYRLSQ